MFVLKIHEHDTRTSEVFSKKFLKLEFRVSCIFETNKSNVFEVPVSQKLSRGNVSDQCNKEISVYVLWI